MPDYEAYIMETAESVVVMDDGKTLVLKFNAEIGGELKLALPIGQGTGLLAGLSAAIAKANSRASGRDISSFLTPSKIGIFTPDAEPGMTFIQFDFQGVEMNMRIDIAAVKDLITRLQTSLTGSQRGSVSKH